MRLIEYRIDGADDTILLLTSLGRSGHSNTSAEDSLCEVCDGAEGYPTLTAPGLLEDYAVRFDEVFALPGAEARVREYLAELLAPRHRNKTLTALAGTEPVVEAQRLAMHRLHFFLFETV